MSHVMQQVADLGATPVQKTAPDANRRMEAPGFEAQGWALAQSVLTENMHQLQARGVWNRYVARLIEFSEEARAAFIKALNSDTKARREHVKAVEGQDCHALYKKANASAQVMISNLKAIAQAMGLGFVVECETTEEGQFKRDGQGCLIPSQPFTVNLAQARMCLEAHKGKGTRGRPALSFEAQLANWLAKTAKVNTKEDKEAYEKAVDLLTQAGLVKTASDEQE